MCEIVILCGCFEQECRSAEVAQAVAELPTGPEAKQVLEQLEPEQVSHSIVSCAVSRESENRCAVQHLRHPLERPQQANPRSSALRFGLQGANVSSACYPGRRSSSRCGALQDASQPPASRPPKPRGRAPQQGRQSPGRCGRGCRCAALG